MAENDTTQKKGGRVAQGPTAPTLPAGRGPAVAEPPVPVGTKVGNCVLRRVLGRGGMGVVYEGHDETLDRRVAVKLLSRELASDDRLAQRFQREARSMAKLSHPNIVSVYSAGSEDGNAHLVMEYVEGEDVAAKIAFQPLPVDEALKVTLAVARALKEAHGAGVLHRDIKPSNVMISKAGEVKVLDFGLAKIHDKTVDGSLTQPAEIMGSPHYMSPEQAKGQAVDARSDVYSLGATFYHMMVGRPPFDDTSLLGILHKHATVEVPRPRSLRGEVPVAVEEILLKMMAKDPRHRFADGGQLVTALEAVQRHLQLRGPLGSMQRIVVDLYALATRGQWSWGAEPVSLRRLEGIFLAMAALCGLVGLVTHSLKVGPWVAMIGRPIGLILLVGVSFAAARLMRVNLPAALVIHLETCLLVAAVPLWVLPGHAKVLQLVAIPVMLYVLWLRYRAYSKVADVGTVRRIALCLVGSLITLTLSGRD